jgi:hypothetical protein
MLEIQRVLKKNRGLHGFRKDGADLETKDLKKLKGGIVDSVDQERHSLLTIDY